MKHPELVASLMALAVTLGGTASWGFCRTTTARSVATAPGTCNPDGDPLSWRSHCAGFSLYRGDIPQGITVRDLDHVAQNDGDCVGRDTDVDCVALRAGEAWARVRCDNTGLDGQYFQLLELPATWNPPGYALHGENSNTVSFRHVWDDDATHRMGTIAITVVTFDALTGEIFDADVELNTFDTATGNTDGFTFSTTDMTDPMSADLPTILTHEFGHFQGLAHTANDMAVMWYEAGLGEARRTLTADDTAGICTIYPATATPDTRCNPVPYGGLAEQPGTDIVTGSGGCRTEPGTQRCTGATGTLAVLTALTALTAVGRCRRRRRRQP